MRIMAKKARHHLRPIGSLVAGQPTAAGQLRPAPLDLDRVMSEAQTAEIIGYSKDTLRREFRAGRAPPRIRLSGRRIGYRLSAIYAWLDARTEKADVSAD
jgi:predicted DNA-binding transcriptional regulator AlpA